MGSIISGIIQKVTGIPPIDFRKGKGKDLKDPNLSALIEQLAGQQAAELVRKLPDDALALIVSAGEAELKRRLDE